MLSPITKIIEDNIFEGMTYRFYIFLLFDYVIENIKILFSIVLGHVPHT